MTGSGFDIRLGVRRSAIVLVGCLVALVSAGTLRAAGTTSFDDIGDSVHREAIELIAQEGITKGCGLRRYCPEDPVTRDQMAAFLTRAFRLASGRHPFSDVQGSIFGMEIGAIYRAGITTGCNPPHNTKYCPGRPVTRGEMATFLARALGLDPSSGAGGFTDIGHSVHASHIVAIAKRGITRGCNPPKNDRFCPDREVTRGEMATFLVRALGISDGSGLGESSGPPPDSPPEEPREPEWEVPIPPDAVTLRPGDDLHSQARNHPQGTTFVLEPGTYDSQQVVPRAGQTFVGKAGAVLRGNGKAHAFIAYEPNVTVAGLEITGYKPNSRTGVIQSSGIKNWRVIGNNIHHNAEIGVKASAGWLVAHNRIAYNGRYGLQAFGDGVVIYKNEIAYNRTDSSHPTGDSGGTKFVRTVDIVIRENRVHNNFGNGIWVDIDNVNPLIEKNVVVGNERSGIFIEISCGGTIRDNYLEANGLNAPYPSWIGEGTAIQVANSPNVSVYRNTLVGNGKGIGGINWDHPHLHTVTKCEPKLKNLVVYENNVTQSSGPVAGIDATIDRSDVWSRWGNRFHSNTYQLSGTARFRWEGKWLDYAEWRALGLN